MRHFAASLLSHVLSCLVLAGAAGGVLIPFSVQANNGYDALIQRARAGDTEPALAYLRQLGTAANRDQHFDHIVIASWAGQADEALSVYQSLPKLSEAPPAQVMQAVARSLRDLKHWPEALAHWRAGLAWYPDVQIPFAAGLTMTLADAGQLDEAVHTGQKWVERWPNDADLRLALAYVHHAQGKPFDALHQTDRALQLAGHSPWVQREYTQALRRTGLVRQALQHAETHPELYPAAQLRALAADVAALQARLAAMPTRNEADRFVIADRALARYDGLLADWQAQGEDAAADVARLRVDRLQALHARVRMNELTDEYEALTQSGVLLPVWALNDVADAYLYQREPERASDVQKLALAGMESETDNGKPAYPEDSPDLLEVRIGLSHALAEAGRFDELAPLVAQIEQSQPPVYTLPGQPEPIPNEHYLDAQLAVVTARMATDDTPAAQEKMEDLVARAPNNANLRTELAGVYRARGEPRRAEVQLKLAETMAPRALTVEVGQGLTALDLQEWQQAEELSADAMARFPEDLGARRLARLVEVHHKTEVRVNIHRGLASDSPVSGRGDLGLDTVAYSPPINHHWRGFAGLGYASGKYAEGRGHATWQRGGAEWRSRDWWVEGEVSAQRAGRGGKLGLRVAASVDVDDHWQVGGALARHALDTPLRALASGISSDTLQTYLRWRANERREWCLGLSARQFSDGNDRLTLTLSGSERLYTGPRFKLDLWVDVATQHSSKDAARPYFNPKRDWMLLPGLRATHVLYRRYETVWEQFVTASVGAYRQQGFGAGRVLGLSYGQRYRYNDVLEMMLRLDAISRPYDGRRERELQLLFDLIFRF